VLNAEPRDDGILRSLVGYLLDVHLKTSLVSFLQKANQIRLKPAFKIDFKITHCARASIGLPRPSPEPFFRSSAANLRLDCMAVAS
jgi:hypothetical protein